MYTLLNVANASEKGCHLQFKMAKNRNDMLNVQIRNNSDRNKDLTLTHLEEFIIFFLFKTSKNPNFLRNCLHTVPTTKIIWCKVYPYRLHA